MSRNLSNCKAQEALPWIHETIPTILRPHLLLLWSSDMNIDPFIYYWWINTPIMYTIITITTYYDDAIWYDVQWTMYDYVYLIHSDVFVFITFSQNNLELRLCGSKDKTKIRVVNDDFDQSFLKECLFERSFSTKMFTVRKGGPCKRVVVSQWFTFGPKGQLVPKDGWSQKGFSPERHQVPKGSQSWKTSQRLVIF